MRLILHPDPHTLEAELLRGIAAVKSGAPLAPVLVVVPTRRLARHVERRLATRLGAVAAVEVLTYRGTARRLLRAAGVEVPDPADPRVLEGLLDRVVRVHGGDEIASFVRRRPAALGSLLGTLRELREAGIAPSALIDAGAGDLAGVYSRYVDALAARRSSGLLDEADWIAAAVCVAPVEAARWAAVFHHGAYEVVGMHLDLLLAADRGTEVAWLAPVSPGSRATEYAEAFFRRQLPEGLERARAPESPANSPLGPRLRHLYDETATLSPLDGSDTFLDVATTQGPEAEVERAFRVALAETARGVPPAEIALVARSLEPYSPFLESVASREELPVHAQVTAPLRREPAPRDFLFLLRAVAEGFPRGLTAEVLRSPHLRWPGEQDTDALHRAEAWSRGAGIVGGLDAWEHDLPAWAGEPRFAGDPATEDRRALARRIAAAVREAGARLAPSDPRSWMAHEKVFSAAMETYLPEGHDELREAIRTLGDLERLAGDNDAVPFSTAVTWLERIVDRRNTDSLPSSPGGIAVLDAMQARGLTFDRVAVLGLNAGAFPRGPREDPFLSDDARAAIRGRTGRPLAVKREAEAEERQLLAAVIGAAGGRLSVSWQRADASGRARAASLALREVARLVRGSPDLAGMRASAAAMPSHPRERIVHLAGRTGLLRPDEAVLVTALGGRADAETARRVRVLDPRLTDGLEMLLATEAFDGRLGPYDGRVGRPFLPKRGFAVTALERLGACPLQFFFRDVLRVRELDEEADPFEAEARDIGARVHDLLRDVYRALAEESLLGRDPKTALRRARAVLDERWDANMGWRGTRLAASFPVLHGVERARWRQALASFLRDDLERAARTTLEGVELETGRDGEIPLPGGESLRVHGRLDRLLRFGDGPVVGEYKTSGRIPRRGNITNMLKGTALQVPLYHLLTGGAGVEVLGVGPPHDPEEGVTERERVARFDGWENDEQRNGFLETLAVLTSLPRRGAYPLLDDEACRWCAYVAACRKGHVPTALRHEREDADLRDLRRKNKSKAPVLAKVRGEDEG